MKHEKNFKRLTLSKYGVYSKDVKTGTQGGIEIEYWKCFYLD